MVLAHLLDHTLIAMASFHLLAPFFLTLHVDGRHAKNQLPQSVVGLAEGHIAVAPACSGIRVEKCRDCRGEFACGTCFKVADKLNAPIVGVKCTKKHFSQQCWGSDNIGHKTMRCTASSYREVNLSILRDKTRVPVQGKTCQASVLDGIVLNQERPSLPDNSFSLCSATTLSLADSVLNITPLIVRVPMVAKLAVEWLIFVGGYDHLDMKSGTAQVGNPMTAVGPQFRHVIRHLPSSQSPLISYTTLMPSRSAKPKKLVVYCHANAEGVHHIHDGGMLGLANWLDAMIAAFEYPGYGGPQGTRGQPTIPSVKWVTLAALNWARQMWGYAEQDIILMGRSIGTGAATEAAAIYEQEGHPVGGLILLSPYVSIRRLVTDFVGGWSAVGLYAADSYTFQTGRHIGAMNRTPVLIVHGTKDEVIPVQHATEIYRQSCESCRLSARVALLLSEGYGHNDLTFDHILDEVVFRHWIDSNPVLMERVGAPLLQHTGSSGNACQKQAHLLCAQR